MPGGDGTGPMGMGPMTGGGRGYCAIPMGRGMNRPFAGRPSGRGRGWRHSCCATGMPGWMRDAHGYTSFGGGYYSGGQELTAQQEIKALKEEKNFIDARIKKIQEQIEDSEKE